MALLAVEGVSKSFGGLEALKNVSLSVNEQEILGLIGPNGAGKSTLFNVVSGHLKPTQGRVIFRGQEVQNRPPHELARLGIGRTFQIVRPFADMTVVENVVAGCGSRLYSTARAIFTSYAGRESMEVAHRLLGEVGLQDYDQVRADALPIGMQRRLEIARALALDPTLLLFDEPTAGLSPGEAHELGQLIWGLREQGKAVVLIEHNMPFAMQLCDRIVVLSFGEVIAEGSPDQVRRDPRVVDAYLGRPANAERD